MPMHMRMQMHMNMTHVHKPVHACTCQVLVQSDGVTLPKEALSVVRRLST